MKINLSKFHKIECDDNCTTLMHPSGHEIKIAHKGLSPDMKEDLDKIPLKLAKGGYAKYSQQFDPSIQSKASKPSEAAKAPASMAGIPPRSATRAYTEPDDAGPDVVLAALHKEAPPFGVIGTEHKQHYPPCINPSCKSFGKSHPNCRCYGGVGGSVAEAGHFAKGGEVELYCDDTRAHKKSCEYYKAGGMAGEEAGLDKEFEGADMAADNAENTPQNVGKELGQETQQFQTDLAAQPAPTPAPEQPEQMPETERAPAAAPVGAAQEMTPQVQVPEASPLQKFQSQKDTNLNDLHQESQMFQQDVNAGHITPKTYSSLFHDKSTLGKIGTMFGLLLSGAGSGLSGQPNALLGMMDKQIENDLRAQQESAGNQQNYLKINQQNLMNQAQAGNVTVDTNTKAYALAKSQMNNAALHSLVENANKLPPGPQKDQAMQTLAMMNNAVQNENFNILDRAATASALGSMLGGKDGGNTMIMKSGMMGPEAKEVGKDIEEKTIPGIPGKASMPLTSEDRNKITSGMEFQKKLDNFMKWSKSHSGSLNPKDMNYGKALAAQLQGAYREATNGGVYKEGEQNFISKIITEHPTKFFNSIRVMPQLQAVKDDHTMRMDQLLKSKGFSGFKGSQGNMAQSAPIERADKSGKVWLYDPNTKKPMGAK